MSKAMCRNCKEILESKYRHDFVVCKCRRESDELNGKFRETLKRYQKEGMQMTEGQIHLACCAFEEIIGHGMFLDGGDDYLRYGGNIDDVEILEEPKK